MNHLERAFFILAAIDVMWSLHSIASELRKLAKNFEYPLYIREGGKMQPQMKDMHADPKR